MIDTDEALEPISVRNELKRLALPISSLITVSLVSNLLMLTGPLFMLQVYDRVLTSQSLPTLLILTILVGFLFAFYAFLESLRARMTLRIGNAIDLRLRGRLFRTAVRMKLAAGGPSNADPVRDGDIVRQFISGSGVLAFLDLPLGPYLRRRGVPAPPNSRVVGHCGSDCHNRVASHQ